MFFILSKLLYFLLMPFTWMMALLFLAWRTKSPGRKRKILYVVLLLALFFTSPLIYKKAATLWQPPVREIQPGEHYAVGIVLSGMVGFDQQNRGFFGNSADRFIQTLTLYHRGVINKILITGGSSTVMHLLPSEAPFLANYFITNSVKQEDIYVEGQSRNTYENAIYSKQLLDSLQIKGPILLITSAEHMRRSVAVFKHAGFQFQTYPCDYKEINHHFSIEQNLLPNPKYMDYWTTLLKEMIGLMVYALTDKA